MEKLPITRMRPSVYLYNETHNGVEVYFGEYSTLEGLSLLDKSTELYVTKFGATSYRRYGWATENDIPLLRSVGSVIQFLESENNIDIIEFEATLPDLGNFRTHDDGECHFLVQSKYHGIRILNSVIPPRHRNLLIYSLVSHPGLYLTCNATGNITKYHSFDEYIAQNS